MFFRTYITIALCAFFLFSQAAFAQLQVDKTVSSTNPKLNRERGLNMLDEIKTLIKENYYDKNFRGINLDERFKLAKEKIKTLDTNRQIFRVIAQVVLDFNDSHTRFYPPNRAYRVEYGFTMQMIGQNCFVTDVKKGSDAEEKGLKVGDLISGVGDFAPTRDNLWKMYYLFYALDPQEKIKLYVISPNEKNEREIEVKAVFKSPKEQSREAEKRRKKKVESPYKCQKVDFETIACKLETFSVETKYIDKMMKETEGFKKLILDLRGNGGGYVKTEEYLTGHFFDRNVKIADFIMRDKTKERIAKTQKEKVFKGDLIVLIDSDSASASEVFARVIQLEKRGKVVGDQSAGAVMTSYFITMSNWRGASGFETVSFFGMNITIADLVMSDGKRLENIGVMPDYPVGPTGQALFEKLDPVLSYAAELLGAKISSSDAGKFGFIIQKAEDEDEESDEKEN